MKKLSAERLAEIERRMDQERRQDPKFWNLSATSESSRDVYVLLTHIDAVEAERDALADGMESIHQWVQAYPATIFKEPTVAAIASANEALRDHGFTIDGLHGTWARYLTKEIGAIVRDALRAAGRLT